MNRTATTERARSPLHARGARRTILIANPSSDIYGSDLQMLQTATALRGDGWRVVVAAPERGELTPALEGIGAEILCVSSPVLRRSWLSLSGILKLGSSVSAAIPRLVRVIRRIQPDVVYVNTETIPWWIAAARIAGVRSVCHIHEAEVQDPRLVRMGLEAPLHLASAIVANGAPAVKAMTLRRPRARAHQVYNGVPMPDDAPDVPSWSAPFRTAVVGRLSPRKATHVALEAVSLVRRRGGDVTLDICGTPFAGYEWYERELRDRATRPDLEGAVRFVGYVSPIWPALAQVNALLAPSYRESFGNVVVEAQFAERPVVAAAAMGHLETVVHEETGLLVEPGSAQAMASGIERIIASPQLQKQIVTQAKQRAVERFSLDRYHADMIDLVRSVAERGR